MAKQWEIITLPGIATDEERAEARKKLAAKWDSLGAGEHVEKSCVAVNIDGQNVTRIDWIEV